MDQVHSNEVEVLIVQFEMHVKASFVSHLLAEDDFLSHGTMIGLNSIEHLLLRFLNKSDDEHF